MINKEEISKYRQAGKIIREVKEYAKKIVKPGMPLLEIAEKIEEKIIKLGGKPAFPVNLSIDDIGAHYTPSNDDKTKASGLLKVDMGVHIDGYLTDTTISIDLENSEENKKLIQAAEKALDEAVKTIKSGTELWEIGEKTQKVITSMNFSPVRNLSGHKIDRYKIHAGLTIPNVNNGNKTKINPGVYAIEPFATTGQGEVYEGKPSGIFRLKNKKPIRDLLARKILSYIEENYSTLPFCSRWLIKEFGTKALFSLKLLEQQDILHQYHQLIEKSHKKISQAEHTLIVTEKEVEILS